MLMGFFMDFPLICTFHWVNFRRTLLETSGNYGFSIHLCGGKTYRFDHFCFRLFLCIQNNNGQQFFNMSLAPWKKVTRPVLLVDISTTHPTLCVSRAVFGTSCFLCAFYQQQPTFHILLFHICKLCHEK